MYVGLSRRTIEELEVLKIAKLLGLFVSNCPCRTLSMHHYLNVKNMKLSCIQLKLESQKLRTGQGDYVFFTVQLDPSKKIII